LRGQSRAARVPCGARGVNRVLRLPARACRPCSLTLTLTCAGLARVSRQGRRLVGAALVSPHCRQHRQVCVHAPTMARRSTQCVDRAAPQRGASQQRGCCGAVPASEPVAHCACWQCLLRPRRAAATARPTTLPLAAAHQSAPGGGCAWVGLRSSNWVVVVQQQPHQRAGMLHAGCAGGRALHPAAATANQPPVLLPRLSQRCGVLHAHSQAAVEAPHTHLRTPRRPSAAPAHTRMLRVGCTPCLRGSVGGCKPACTQE
jgi:hypothetical protein